MGRTWTSSRFSQVDPGSFRPDRSARSAVGGTFSFPGVARTQWGFTSGAMKFKIQIKGLTKFRQAAVAIKAQGRKGSATSLYEEGVEIMNESKKPHNVPVKTGLLKSTGHVQLPTVEGNRIVVNLGYGGPSCKYALIQHEGNFNHPRGGRRQFLLIPAQEAQRGIEQRLSKKLGRSIKIAVEQAGYVKLI